MPRTQDEWAKQWPLHHAAQGGKGAAQRLEALLGTEASLSEADRQAGTSALTNAQRRELLDQKETHTGRTALHYAVSIADLSKEGSTRPTQVLLENGADVFALDKDGRTPLDLALSFRDWEYDSKRLQVVSMLRSEVDAAWSKGRRPSPWSARHPWDNGYKEHHPLHEACCRDDLIAVQRILGPILNDTTGSLTPPQPAVALADEDFDEPTSEATDQLEARNAYGHTPLLVAAGNGAYRAATLLLKHGADVAAKDANGKNALDLARMHENQDMLSLLLNGSGGADGGVPGAPVAPQAKAALEAQAGEEVESEEEEEEDPIAAALAKAAAAVAKAEADHVEDTASSRHRAAPRSGSVVPTSVSHVNTSSVPAGASDGDDRVGSKAPLVPNVSDEAELIVPVSTYASDVRAKREKMLRQRDDAASSIGRKPQPPADTAALADQAVQAHLQNLEDRREAMRWDATLGSMVRDDPEYGTLHVRGATGTPRADTYSDNDLYAVIVWNDKEIGRTRCIRNNNSPIWDEFFDLRVFPGVNTLRIQLWEQDKFPDIGEAAADMNSRDEFMGHVIVEGASSNKLPQKVKEFELTGKDELATGDQKAGRSMKSGPDKGLGTLSFCYTPKTRTPVSKRRAHRNMTRSSVPLPTEDLMKEQLLDTRRLDFTFCGLDSCKGIAAVAAKYAIPTWTSKSTKRAKKHLQLHVRGELGAGDAKVRAIELAASKVMMTVAMPPINSPRGHNAALPQAVSSSVHRSPRNQRARGTGAKTARGGRTRWLQNEVDEPNCMYDTFGWLTTRQRRQAAKDKDGDGQQTSSRHAVVDSITLANNELHSLAHFEESIAPFLALHTTHMLQHLDLSCNRLTSLYIWLEGAALVSYMKEQQSTENRSGSPSAPPRVSALATMPNLHTLYLHVNALHSSHELDAIAELKVLRNLSLHGNPLEEKFSNLSSVTHGRTKNTDLASPNGVSPNAATEASGYRLSVIAKIPWLRKLDFVTVTKGERLAISNEATRLSARGLRRRQRMLEQADGEAHSGMQPHRPGAEGHYVSGTHKLVHTLQRIHSSAAAGEHPEKIVAKAVIDTGRN